MHSSLKKKIDVNANIFPTCFSHLIILHTCSLGSIGGLTGDKRCRCLQLWGDAQLTEPQLGSRDPFQPIMYLRALLGNYICLVGMVSIVLICIFPNAVY